MVPLGGFGGPRLEFDGSLRWAPTGRKVPTGRTVEYAPAEAPFPILRTSERKMPPDFERPTRRVVSIVLRDEERPDRILSVRRPADDPDLPGAWGLPAGRIRVGESPERAAMRAGHDKLGVRIGGLRRRASGEMLRTGYRLEMILLEAILVEGTPAVPQSLPGITQYSEARWAAAEILAPATELGSLCCRLFFESEGTSR